MIFLDLSSTRATPPSPECEYWYRADMETLRGCIVVTGYPVLRRTPKCVVVSNYGEPKYCRVDARKKWAYPSREAAIESYFRRKLKQVDILKAELALAEEALAAPVDVETDHIQLYKELR